MTDNDFNLMMTEENIKLFAQSEGFAFSDAQLKAIADNLDTAPQIFSGCIKALNYVDFSNAQQLQQIILSTSKGRIILTNNSEAKTSKTVIKVTNLYLFDKALKNAMDFGHQPCIVVEKGKIVFLSLVPFKCRLEGNRIIARNTAIDSDHSSGG